MGYPPPQELLEFLEAYDPAIRELALALRDVAIKEMTPCYENIYDAYSAVAIGYGPTDRQQAGICHIAVYSGHVNLGFNHGAEMDDPDGILKGTGKQIRHVTIKSLQDVAKPELRKYLRMARAKSTLKTDVKKGVVSVVKAIYATKRRPSGPAAR